MLGSRAVLGRIALNRCVTVRTPRSKARCASAAVASVWPADTVMPRATSSSISSNAPGSSGASVTWDTGAASSSRRSSAEIRRRAARDVVHAEAPRRQERPLDVRAEHARPDALQRHRVQRGDQRLLGRGHERRLEGRRAGLEQRLADADVARAVGRHQVHAREPVDLEVDEPGRGDAAPGATEQPDGDDRRRRRPPRLRAAGARRPTPLRRPVSPGELLVHLL